MKKSFAIYGITRHGARLAARVAAALPGADLFVSDRVAPDAPLQARRFRVPLGSLVAQTFREYECHVFVVSVGAVVRIVAPLLADKKTDPAVVCVDEVGRFAVCVLSGHVGRGNAFAERIASILGASAVVTTASDALGTLAVDILGREFGWTLDDPDRNVTRGCAAVVNGFPVVFVQETGEPDWWPLDRPLPPGIGYAVSLDDVDPSEWEVLLVATDREFHRSHPEHWQKAVIYRPKSLAVGIGCDRGATPEMVERGLRSVFAEEGLSLKSIRAIATLDRKRDEEAIRSLADTLGVPLRVFTAEDLDRVEGIETPSETVRFFVGTRGVAEPAALLASSAERLAVPKRIYSEPGAGRSMTLAVARVPFPKRPEAPG